MADVVFISYSRVDKEIVDQLVKTLQELHIEYFLDTKDIEWGEPVTQKIQHGLSNCLAVVVAVSPASLKSPWVPFEIGHAMGAGNQDYFKTFAGMKRVTVEQAKAFEVSWCIVKIADKQSPYPDADLQFVKMHLEDVGISIDRSLLDTIKTNDGSTSANSLLQVIGAYIKARKRHLLLFFEAGVNLIALAQEGKYDRFIEEVQRLNLSPNLTTAREDLFAWANDIHRHYVGCLEA